MDAWTTEDEDERVWPDLLVVNEDNRPGEATTQETETGDGRLDKGDGSSAEVKATASAVLSARIEPAEAEMRPGAKLEEPGACGGQIPDINRGAERQDVGTPSTVTHGYNLRSRSRAAGAGIDEKTDNRPPWRF